MTRATHSGRRFSSFGSYCQHSRSVCLSVFLTSVLGPCCCQSITSYGHIAGGQGQGIARICCCVRASCLQFSSQALGCGVSCSAPSVSSAARYMYRLCTFSGCGGLAHGDKAVMPCTARHIHGSSDKPHNEWSKGSGKACVTSVSCQQLCCSNWWRGGHTDGGVRYEGKC